MADAYTHTHTPGAGAGQRALARTAGMPQGEARTSLPPDRGLDLIASSAVVQHIGEERAARQGGFCERLLHPTYYADVEA